MVLCCLVGINMPIFLFLGLLSPIWPGDSELLHYPVVSSRCNQWRSPNVHVSAPNNKDETRYNITELLINPCTLERNSHEIWQEMQRKCDKKISFQQQMRSVLTPWETELSSETERKKTHQIGKGKNCNVMCCIQTAYMHRMSN